MITTIVFSRDRACQLDHLLRSLPAELNPVHVIAYASSDDHRRAYKLLMEETDRAAFEWQQESIIRRAGKLLEDGEDLGCFLTDDSIFFRESLIPTALDFGVVCHSLRLGANTSLCYPLARTQRAPAFISNNGTLMWDWTTADGDYGYPGSLDGHLFRLSHLRRMLTSADRSFNPNQLEGHFNRWCHSRLKREFPLMRSGHHSSLVGVPVNRVNDTHPNRNGIDHPTSVDDFLQAFLEGRRLALAEDPQVNGAHQELRMVLQ